MHLSGQRKFVQPGLHFSKQIAMPQSSAGRVNPVPANGPGTAHSKLFAHARSLADRPGDGRAGRSCAPANYLFHNGPQVPPRCCVLVRALPPRTRWKEKRASARRPQPTEADAVADAGPPQIPRFRWPVEIFATDGEIPPGPGTKAGSGPVWDGESPLTHYIVSRHNFSEAFCLLNHSAKLQYKTPQKAGMRARRPAHLLHPISKNANTDSGKT